MTSRGCCRSSRRPNLSSASPRQPEIAKSANNRQEKIKKHARFQEYRPTVGRLGSASKRLEATPCHSTSLVLLEGRLGIDLIDSRSPRFTLLPFSAMPEFSIPSIDFGSPRVLLLIAVAALIQDDLTCLVVSSAVAGGKIAPLPAATACLAGIWLGDIAWFLSTRLLGQKLLTVWPFRMLITEDKLQQARERLEQLGVRSLFVSRFLPIVRTPLQVTSGLLARSTLPGCITLLIAGVVYVAVFIGTASAVGQTDVVRNLYEQYGVLALASISLVIWVTMTLTQRCLLKKTRPDS